MTGLPTRISVPPSTLFQSLLKTSNITITIGITLLSLTVHLVTLVISFISLEPCYMSVLSFTVFLVIDVISGVDTTIFVGVGSLAVHLVIHVISFIGCLIHKRMLSLPMHLSILVHSLVTIA